MSWRTVVITERAKLDLRLGYLVIRGEQTKKVHLGEIAVLIIESTAVSLTASLISALIEKKVKVIFCDEKRNPQSELLPYYGSHNTSVRIRSQINWDESAEQNVWTEIVKEKIKKQSMVLELQSRSEYLRLLEYAAQVQHNDSTNREGHAAKVYFNALFGKDFTRSGSDPVNAALNYGYSILLSLFNRIVTAGGYLTQIGIFHDNMFNCFNLSSDLMEPFRPVIDLAVAGMQLEEFGKEEKKTLLELLSSEVKIDGKKHHLINAAEVYANSVFNAIESNEVSMIKFYEL